MSSGHRLSSPVMNLHVDVLKLIFEATMRPFSNTIPTNCRGISELRRQANILSSICLAWRRTAIDTPRIWTYISIYMSDDRDTLVEYWLLSLKRVRHVPIIISINDISSRSSTPLPVLALMDTLIIDTLELHFKHPVDTKLFPGSWRSYPIGTLRIFVQEYDAEDPLNKAYFGSVIGNAQSCFLQTSCYSQPSFSGIANAPVRRLSLEWIEGVDIESIVHAFPALESFEMNGCFVRPLSKVTTASKLKFLTIREDTGSNWIVDVHFPKLQELSYHGKGGFPDVLEIFLASHSTIRALSLSCARSVDWVILAGCAGQVSSLIVRIENRRAARMDPLENPTVFPALEVLGVIRGVDFLSPSDFERNITTRHTRQYPQNPATGTSSVLKQFHIAVGGAEAMNRNCFESDLYREAIRRSMEVLEKGDRLYLAWAPE